ncbi:MAG: Na+/H+ antiporter NhaC family protein [Cetobacterium sp.]|nr:Na+/H+ antiporter NhaC family protein [Cetobacterium sp.]
MEKAKANFKGLIPFVIFIVVYLGTGLYFQLKGTSMAFYQLPSPIAIVCGIISAFVLFKESINEKFETLVKGCGNSDIIIMCIIYLLAGAFAAVTKKIGGVDATANLGLSYIPIEYITAGIFVITSFISTATGTSVGSVVAIAPIAIELAEKTQLSLPILLAAVMGGAMFGDDLSLISDTTISATRTQGCRMKDKFLANVGIAIPAAAITFILFFIFGRPETIIPPQEYTYNLLKIIPYIFVLVVSLMGVNVFVVLTGGIFLSGAIGIYYGTFSLIGLAREVYIGFNNMNEIFLLSLLTGGLAALVTKAGGIQWILEKVDKFIVGRKSAQVGIGILVALTDFAVANNTVAIIINGPLAKKISQQHGIDKRRVAGLLGICSCIAQGIIPYGAQMLILIGFTKGLASPFEVLPYLWYQQLLLLFTIISIYIPYYRYFFKHHSPMEEMV